MSEVKLVKRSEVDQSITWDMSLLYPSDEAYRTTLKETEAQLKSFKEKYEDKLADLEVLTAATAEYEALYETFYRLSHYAELPMTVDRFNDTVVENATLFEQLASAWALNMSFYDTEKLFVSKLILYQKMQNKSYQICLAYQVSINYMKKQNMKIWNLIHLKQMEKHMKIVLFYMKTYMRWIIIQKFVVMQRKVSIKH